MASSSSVVVYFLLVDIAEFSSCCCDGEKTKSTPCPYYDLDLTVVLGQGFDNNDFCIPIGQVWLEQNRSQSSGQVKG